VMSAHKSKAVNAPDVGLWLQADLKPPEIDFRFTPRSRHFRGRH
jgi:hypothetical protein